MVHLQYLRMAVTKLEGEIPDKVVQIKGGLAWLSARFLIDDIGHSLLLGRTLPCFMFFFLRYLRCGRPPLSGLRELDLSCARLCGRIPKPLDCGAKLAVLNLSHNRLDGEKIRRAGKRERGGGERDRQ